MQNLYNYLGEQLDIATGSGNYTNAVEAGIDNSGLTDVSNAINTLIADGGMFFFPAGTYLLNSQMIVKSNTVIKGEGETTIFKASPLMDAVYNTICNANASNINARLCRNEATASLPATSEFITEYDHNIYLYDFTVDGNWMHRDLVNWDKYYTKGGNQATREPGTNLEIQAAHDVIIENVRAINGVQHNINIRAGAFSYNMGISYKALFPCYRIVIRNCFASNERYDDCITTHDSHNILIDNCVCSVENNANGTYSAAISNGIEVDDGSEFVEVRNCKTYYAVCGFQAKGHDNTPPAHDITFDNCTAFYTQYGFSLACGPQTEYTGQETVEGRCRNINILHCAVIKPYVPSNITSWAGALMFVAMKNTLNVNIEDLYVENSGAPDGVQNDYGQATRTMLVNMREKCINTVIRNIKVTNPITCNYSDWGLIVFYAGSHDAVIENVFLNGFTGNPIIKLNDNSSDYYLKIDGIYTPRIAQTDSMLSLADAQINLQGERKNMIYTA